MPGVIRCRDLTKRFAERVAVDHLSLDVRAGEIVVILGGNGAGKSTLLRMIAGRLTPDEGSAEVAGADVVTDRRRAAARLGAVLSAEGAWYSRLDALANLEFFGVAAGLARTAARDAAVSRIEEAGLADVARRPVGTCSRGMRARLAIARALLADPSVLLLDEPSAGLDLESRERFADQLDAQRARRAVVLATHSASEAAALADRVVLLDGGRAVARLDGPVDTEEITRLLHERRAWA